MGPVAIETVAANGRRTPAPEPVIAAVSVSKRFGKDVLALDTLSLEVPPGTIFGLLGPNGAGKTTLLRIILGLVHPTAGQVFLFGRRMYPGSQDLRRVGTLVESAGFVPHLSGFDNLRLYWETGGQPLRESHLDEALEIADLGPAIRRKVRTYSKGMLQRLAVAQALLNQPDLLVLDEPTNGLDPQEMREIRDMIRRVARRDATVLLSSHILAEVEQVCSHAAVINRGRLVANGAVEELIGGRSDIYLEVDDVERAQKILAETPGIERVSSEPPGLSLQLDGFERKNVAAVLVKAGIGVETLTSRRRLEDAFIDMLQGDEH